GKPLDAGRSARGVQRAGPRRGSELRRNAHARSTPGAAHALAGLSSPLQPRASLAHAVGARGTARRPGEGMSTEARMHFSGVWPTLLIQRVLPDHEQPTAELAAYIVRQE